MRKIDTHNFVRATRSTPREINRQIALNLVREHQPISRAELARRMQIGRGMITSIVTELIEEGSVYEGATADTPRGRRPRMLHVRTRDRLGIGVDVRFGRTFLMLGDFAGTQLALETFDTMLDPACLVGELSTRIRRLVETFGHHGGCEGIGLVVPGMVDRRTGRVLNAPQLGWRDVEIRGQLSEATGLPVYIENAPNACALSQMWLGHGSKAADNFIYVTVSEGVGTGIVANGAVIRGHTNSAGEFGHVPLDQEGPRCLCGSRGCWEAYTSNLATLTRYLGVELSPERCSDMLRRSGLTMGELIARARTGDEKAASAIRATGHYLGVGLAMIVNALNPARMFVAGEITEAWDLVEPSLRAAIGARALTAAAAATPIIPEQVGGYPRLRGALALVAAPHFAAPRVA